MVTVASCIALAAVVRTWAVNLDLHHSQGHNAYSKGGFIHLGWYGPMALLTCKFYVQLPEMFSVTCFSLF